MPDVVDGIIGAFHGHFGQTIGHSFVGLGLFCLPGGLILWLALHKAARRVRSARGSGFLARSWNRGLATFLAGAGTGRWRRILAGLGLGAFSHMFFDLISHGGFPWLLPWVPKIRIFPDWWYVTWMRLDVPGYREPYPVGPHFIVWLFLGILGAYLLFRPVIRRDESVAGGER